MVRYAFTLIELIFAIVIIGITVITLPMMNQIISKGIEGNIVQEAIFASATKLNQITTAYWDDNSFEPGYTELNSSSRIINVSGDCNPISKKRAGDVSRRCLDDNTTTASNTNSRADITSLDDMAHPQQALFLNPTPSKSGYKNSYTSTVTVTPNAIFAGSANPNMKKITITVKNSDGKIVTSLNTYSANIGEPPLPQPIRRYP